MRPPLRRLKERSPVADHPRMAPGGRRLSSRSWRTFAVVATLCTGLTLPQVPAAAAATSPSADYSAGDAGSGPSIPTGATPLLGRATAYRWADLDADDKWAKPAIDYVAGTHDWMRDFVRNGDGAYPFHPDATEKRRLFARSMVKAFARDEKPDPSIVFSDLDPSSKFWRFANVAVKLGWLTRTSHRAFLPDKAVRMITVHKAIVLALGLRKAAKALNKLHTRDGAGFRVPGTFGTTILGMRIGLRYSSLYEDHDVHPWTPMPREQVAYSLYRAKTVDAGYITWVGEQYAHGVELPRMRPARRAIVRWGVRFAGYPYVWGGEWGKRSQEPSALGGQSIPGFDCSGWTWWLMRKNDSYAWKVHPPRPYRGWSLPQRSSAEMASGTNNRLGYRHLLPGDLMFYDGDGNGVTDHVDVFIGNGWALDSSNTPAGVTVMWVGTDWYREHFLFGRRIVPV